MKENIQLTFPAQFHHSRSKFGNCNAMAFVGQEPITYNELGEQIEALIFFLEQLGIERGDKVAILSANTPNWGIAYYAVAFMGAVVVPLLPDFSTSEIDNILQHSEAKAIFVSRGLKHKVKGLQSSFLQSIVGIEDFSLLECPMRDVQFELGRTSQSDCQVEEDDLAAIIYTSGTTGNSKGVMLSHKNICFNAQRASLIHPVDERDRFLSILPLSHTYENTLGFVLPMLKGACIYYLQKPPTPSILLPALQKVRPTVMFSVPLIIEKIYKGKVLPSFNKGKLIRFLYRLPLVRKRLNAIAGKKLLKTFGGELVFFGIGGAKLNPVVEEFLIEAKFPYAIGYGLTETAPLLAGACPSKIRLQSTGPAVVDVDLKISNPDPKTGIGEIWAKGSNVMKGYYKDPEKTREVFTKDGWFKTGDLGRLDKNNFLYIEGRLKNMIVGASGENIYPEEIESLINNFKHVVDSLVVQKKGKLVALVHFNYEELEQHYRYLREGVEDFVDARIDELLQELRVYINTQVNKFSQVQMVVAQSDPFQKTATQKIKRYLYM
ncbi:MAG: AMP-binding protein [Marinifilaceae bacterium]